MVCRTLNFRAHKIKQLLLALTILVLFASFVVGQKNSTFTPKGWGIPEKPGNCEINAALMEHVSPLMQEYPNPNGAIILVARLGKGETRRELNHRRLFNVSERYRRNLGLPMEKVIETEGKRVDSFGRVEVYWNGELAGALLVSKNSDLCVSCCPANEDHYPDRDAIERKQKRKSRKRG